MLSFRYGRYEEGKAPQEKENRRYISPREAEMIRLLDKIGEALTEKGISLEDMIESGREIRQ